MLNALAPVLPELWGGSADLAGSNDTTMKGEPSFIPAEHQTKMFPGNPFGRTLHFGIREHAMGAILNGIALHGLTRPYGGTFLVFSDYMRGAVRLSALMKQPVTYVWTHDSIGLGEDGPTHQPVEHLWALRAIPGLDVVRPADANETAVAWKTILEHTDRPAGLCLTRQAVPVFDRSVLGPAEHTARGGYVLAEADGGDPRVILIGTGSEVQIALAAREQLQADGRGHPGGLHAVRGVVRRAGRGLPGRGAAPRGPGPGQRGGGAGAGLAPVRRRPGRERQPGAFRRVGRLPEAVRGVRHHRRGRGAGGAGQPGQGERGERDAGLASRVRQGPWSVGQAASKPGRQARRETVMTTQNDRLGQLSALGVAVWLDDISRDRLRTGNLAALMRDFHVIGVTSNPTIFASALSKGTTYDDQVRDLAVRQLTVDEAARDITTFDIRWACDVLRPAYDATGGLDGRVSIEVDPRIARDTDEDHRRGQGAVVAGGPAEPVHQDPGDQGGPAGDHRDPGRGHQRQRHADLLAGALRRGHRRLHGRPGAGRRRPSLIKNLASVASFFVSRVDTEVDARLDKIGTPEALALRGQAAVANARLAYELFEQKTATDRWAALHAAGARPQRPLWASTSTKNPEYTDTMYVTDLVAPGTVNTMPEATLRAVADHGELRGDTIHGTYDAARQYFEQLAAVGVSYDDVVAALEDEGVDKFAVSWNQLLETIRTEMDKAASGDH